jgi:hypothetical protein
MPTTLRKGFLSPVFSPVEDYGALEIKFVVSAELLYKRDNVLLWGMPTFSITISHKIIVFDSTAHR